MAIYHLSVKCISRSRGHSAVAAASYRAGLALLDDRTGLRHDYSRRQGVTNATLYLPAMSPSWSRNQLWNQVEKSETRKNSTVAREVVIALPHELDLAGKTKLAGKMAKFLVERVGCAVDAAIHIPTFRNDSRNAHAHLLCSTRRLGSQGFGAKTRELDAIKTGASEIELWRSTWADFVNEALLDFGSDERVDHRSNKTRGSVFIPTIKVGRQSGFRKREMVNAEARSVNEEIRVALARRSALLLANQQEEEQDSRRAADTFPNSDETDQNMIEVKTKVRVSLK